VSPSLRLVNQDLHNKIPGGVEASAVCCMIAAIMAMLQIVRHYRNYMAYSAQNG